ncbi:MAG TPA: sigma-70 family RNA polymerase sigma factor [Opitutaceae bacterium]|nr:sigma-70 family RNA polymerase sigma factor [Opitutaceae bacterium]
MTSDSELLRRYSEAKDGEAFAELVTRHFGLVYGTAMRRVGGDAHAAKDVAQSVFTDLAKKASGIPRARPLPGWLHTSTCYAAAKLVRTEQRRRRVEQLAFADAAGLGSGEESASDWTAIEPSLDSALQTLSDEDRGAVIMRFFQERSYAEIGTEFSLKEDTARVRVQRSLEKLRAALRRHGIQSTAEALAIALAANNATAAAPSGLAAVIAQIALRSAAMASVGSAAGVITFMSTSKVLGSALAVSLAMSAFLAVMLFRERASTADAEVRRAALEKERSSWTEAPNEIARLRGELGALKKAEQQRIAAVEAKKREQEALETDLDKWLDRIDRLKRFASAHPEWVIPEMQLLTPTNWLDATKGGNLETEADYRQALSTLRMNAKNLIAQKFNKAIGLYLAAHQGVPPADARELAPFFSEPMSNDILDRYTLSSSDEIKNWKTLSKTAKEPFAFTEKAVSDPLWDTEILFAENGVAMKLGDSALRRSDVASAMRTYTEKNGTPPTELAQIAPYLKSTSNPEVLAEVFEAIRSHPVLPPKPE